MIESEWEPRDAEDRPQLQEKDGARSLAQKRARRLHLRALFPFGRGFEDPWNLVWVRWFAFYALLPLVLDVLLSQTYATYNELAWAFTLYFGSVWLGFLTYCMKPEPSGFAVAEVVAVTLAIGTPVALTLDSFGLVSAIYAHTASENPLTRWLAFMCSTGPVEEATKMIALFIFVYYMQPHLRPKTFAYLGAASGLAFGVAEAVAYSMKYSSQLASGGTSVADYLLSELVRLLSVPLMHAVFSGIAGYFMGLAAHYKKAPFALIGIGLVIASICHGTYDAFSGTWLGLIVAATSMLIFLSYVRNEGEILGQLDS